MSKHAPMYVRVRNHILDGIASGRFQPGDRLPSEKELASLFGTTRSTVVHGLQTLTSEGRINREIGRGTFVASTPRRIMQDAHRVVEFEEEIARQGGTVSYRLLSFARVSAPEEVANRLGIEENQEVYRINRIRLVDKVPSVEETRYLPIALGEMMSIEALTRLSMYQILDQQLGHSVARIKGVIRADGARESSAQALGIKAGSPVLVRDYVLYDAAAMPLVSGEAVFRREIEVAYAVDATGAKTLNEA
ncbi:GntR family transcriptional regulator [Pseudogemmobacter sonorensis]|uniref:GntR family transcriptional regulator n=1 Tax=Pseudogemmobacter sonorensis TaxID=2989681 RepID=UPI0036A37A7B